MGQCRGDVLSLVEYLFRVSVVVIFYGMMVLTFPAIITSIEPFSKP